MKIISYKAFDAGISRIVNESVRKNGKSKAQCTLGSLPYTIGVILCVRSDEKKLEVADDWFSILREKNEKAINGME